MEEWKKKPRAAYVPMPAWRGKGKQMEKNKAGGGKESWIGENTPFARVGWVDVMASTQEES